MKGFRYVLLVLVLAAVVHGKGKRKCLTGHAVNAIASNICKCGSCDGNCDCKISFDPKGCSDCSCEHQTGVLQSSTAKDWSANGKECKSTINNALKAACKKECCAKNGGCTSSGKPKSRLGL